MCFSQSVTIFCIKGRSGFVAARHLYDIPVVLFEMVARGGPIREANQDSEAARRVWIGLSRSESIEPPTRGFSVACKIA